MSILHDLRQDARFHHQLRFPELSPTILSWTKVLFGSRGLFVVAVHRLSYCYFERRPNEISRWLYIPMIHLGIYLSKVAAKCHILSSVHFEPGIYLSNHGHIILGARTIGSGTIIHNRVTIGMNLFNRGTPEIGKNVWIGSQCVINGNIKIGDGVTILSGTVLTKSLPPGVVVEGNPARIVKRDFDNFKLRCTLSPEIGSLFK